MLKKTTTVRVRAEIGGQGSERSPSPRPSPARERERLRPRGGNAGAPGWRGTMWGNGGGSRQRVEVWNDDDGSVLAGRVGVDTAVGHRGILTLDLDLNHNLVLSGPVRSGQGNPSQLGWSFVLQDAGGEMLARRNCPENGAGAGGGRESGVKAVPQARDRSPCPGGIRGGLEHDEHPWGLRRWVDTADGGWVGLRRMLEWGCEFIWQGAGSEWVMAMGCPEFAQVGDGGGRGVKAPEGWRSPCPGGIRGGLEHDEHPWGLRRWVDTADGGWVGLRRMLEWGCEFIWQGAGSEWVMAMGCPEFAQVGDGGGRGVKAPEGWRSPRPGGIRGGLEHDEHPWGLRRGVDTADGGLVGIRRRLEWVASSFGKVLGANG